MAEFYIDGDKCKSFEIAIKKITQIRKAVAPIYLNVQFHNGDSISLSIKRVGDRFYFDSNIAALIFDELLIESFYQSKKEC